MARPKKNEMPPADSRIEAVFFDLLEQTPFEKITVSAIVKAAGLNRNTFYYHYSDLNDLAQGAVTNLLVPEIPRLLRSGFSIDSNDFDEALDARLETYNHFNKIPAAVGPHSTTELRAVLKDAVISMWCDTFEVQRDKLLTETLRTLEFAVGGIFELAGKIDPQRDLIEHLSQLRRLSVVKSVIGEVFQALQIEQTRAEQS